jgi:hypothetical protein
MSKAAEHTATHRTSRVCNETTRVRIEQLRAFGHTAVDIARELHIKLSDVQARFVWQDHAAASTRSLTRPAPASCDVPRQPPRAGRRERRLA